MANEQGVDPDFRMKLLLAASLSEQHRFAEALELQQELLASGHDAPPRLRAKLALDLGNTLAALGHVDEASDSYRSALAEAEGQSGEGAEELRAHVRALLAEQGAAAGDASTAVGDLELAERYFETAIAGIERLQFRSRAAAIYFTVDRWQDARRYIQGAEADLTYLLHKGPDVHVWESMLAHWHRLPALAVEIDLASGTDEACDQALLTAETAKARLLSWIRWSTLEGSARLALDAERHERSIRNAKEWCRQGDGRIVVSLFGADRGTAVFALGFDERTQGRWLDDAPYQELLSAVVEPWQQSLPPLGPTGTTFAQSGALTEHTLQTVGEILWRAFPGLADGGETLVLAPHRLFRSVPLEHCRLPGGARLGDLFDEVWVTPTIYDLMVPARRTGDDAARKVAALVDPDGSLPFARLEGALAATPGYWSAGREATSDRLDAELRSESSVLVSCHAEFDPANPWHSTLFLSDGRRSLASIIDPTASKITAPIVVLGACEAARHRRSLSDEPLGFPTALLYGGARAVIAPMWPIDDFASALYITRLSDRLKAGDTAAVASRAAANWLRTLTAAAAGDLVDGWSGLLSERDDDSLSEALARLQQRREWLGSLQPETTPFSSPLDWAAFQVMGVPTSLVMPLNGTEAEIGMRGDA